MLIAKIREYLSTGLAVIACMALAFAAITHLRNQNLALSLDTALANNSHLTQINDDNSKRINDLIAQRRFDDKLINKVFKQYDTLKQNSQQVYNQLESLKRNDQVLKDMLAERHPVSINRLLNDRTTGDEDSNSQTQTAK
ncbi:hypothetical protein pVco14_007 [Vibrio phage pVco-14]|nr:hypothetical protein pVco14_007 [Vibrio phage pVco-14]